MAINIVYYAWNMIQSGNKWNLIMLNLKCGVAGRPSLWISGAFYIVNAGLAEFLINKIFKQKTA